MTEPFYAYLMLTAFLAAGCFFRDWRRERDVFYPTIYFLPQLCYMYVALPLYGLSVDETEFLLRAGYWNGLAEHQRIACLLMLALVLGIWVGARRRQLFPAPARFINSSSVFRVGVFFGLLGLVSWGIGILNVGGFSAAYGQGYGGGWSDSGYIREAAQLGFVSVPLVMLGRRRASMRSIDWFLCLIFIAPLIIQGILGGRRGPTFLALASFAASYIIIFRPKIRLWLALCGGFGVGSLLLFLVANRSSIYIGTDEAFDQPITTIMTNWAGNEYLFSSAIVRYVNETQDIYYGLRILVHMLAKLIPSAWWPTSYHDLADFVALNTDLTKMAGIPVERIGAVVGWQIAYGAAPGMVGDFVLEFGLFSPLAFAMTGWFYGRFWRAVREDSTLQPVYVLLCGLSIYLVTQTIEAWLFRALLFGLPAAMALMMLRHRRQVFLMARGQRFVRQLKRSPRFFDQ